MKAKTKLTKLWSILLVLVMVVGMLPTVALAAEPATEKADFSTDPTAALNLLNAAKTGTEDSTWDPDTNTLTLNGVNFTTTASTAVKLPEAATIVLNGDNIITSGEAKSKDSFGIYAEGSLTISGSGTLNVTSGTANDDCYGIYAKGSIAISGGTVTAEGGTANDNSYGIYTKDNITITDGTVTAEGGTAKDDSYGICAKEYDDENISVNISGGTVTATGGTSGRASLGIYSKGNFTISGTADVTGKGGTATGDGSFGINAEGEVIISGGKVKAIGGAGKGSDGLYSGNGQINISGGKVEAFGGDAPSAGGSFGIFAQTSGANVTITGTADVTARGGESASDRSYGIYSRNPVTISGGKVEAFGGEGCYPGYGINKANISGGTVTAASEYGDAINNVTTGSGFKTISFDRNGGSGEMIAYTNADSYILPANGFTAPTNKQFIGWSESSTGEVIDATTVNATDGKKLYAIWEMNVADFTFGDGTAALALLNAAKTDTADSEWNSVTKTLTLNGVNFETTAATAVRLPADSTIVLNGVNTIKGGNSDSDDCYGIEGLGNLTIQGTGKLDVTSGTTSRTAYDSFGIRAYAVTIKSGTVIAKGGTAQMTEGSMSGGIYGSNYITIEGGIVEATGGAAWRSCGFNIVALGTMNISGGTVTATGGMSTANGSYGIYTNYSAYVNITGGSLIAKAGSAPSAKALPWAPWTLPAIYWWRSSDSGQYKNGSFNWGDVSTYVEIRDTEPITTYTVTFDANGGSGEMAGADVVSGEYTLPANGFTAPAGKQFKAWSVNGNEKAVGDKITVTADTTVKAVWEKIPAAPIEYEILDGANSRWTQDSDGSLSIRGSEAFSEFVGVKVDGKSVDEKYYTVKEGSTIVTLKAGYLNTLTVGSHTLEIVWTDGSASTIFTIEAESPQTGDNSMMALWIAVLFVSGFGVVATAVYGKKRKSVK